MIADPLVWVPERPQTRPTKPQQSRKSHRKSRNGCLTCKSRRVKCDEQQPVCGPCSIRATECRYADRRGSTCALNDGSVRHSGVPGSKASPTTTTRTPMPSRARQQHASTARLAGPGSGSGPRQPSLLPQRSETSTLAQESALGIHAVSSHIASLVSTSTCGAGSANSLPFLLSHFSKHSSTTLSSYTGQMILREKVPGLLLRHKYLLHTVLAFAATHLDYLQRSQATTGHDRHSLLATTAAWHSQRALRLYGEKISWYQARAKHPQEAQDGDFWFRLLADEPSSNQVDEEREDMDAMVACCIMLTSLFFYCHWAEEENFTRSWTKSILPTPNSKEVSNEMSTKRSCSVFTNLPQLHDHDRTRAPTCQGLLSVLSSENSSSAYSPTWSDLTPESTSSVPTPSTAAANNKQQINWLTTITGMAILLSLPTFRKNLQHSIWVPFFREANNKHEPQLNGLDPAFDVALNNLVHGESSSQYIAPVRSKTPLVHARLQTGGDFRSKRTTEIYSSEFVDDFGGTIDCSQITDPRSDFNAHADQLNTLFADPAFQDVPRVNASLSKLYHMVTLMAQHPSSLLRKQQDALQSILSHLVYLLSLDETDLNNFSPIISFPSRLPADFLSLFKPGEEATGYSTINSNPDMRPPFNAHYRQDNVPSTNTSSVFDDLMSYSDSMPSRNPAAKTVPAPTTFPYRPMTPKQQSSGSEPAADDLYTSLAGSIPMPAHYRFYNYLNTPDFASFTADGSLSPSVEPPFLMQKPRSKPTNDSSPLVNLGGNASTKMSGPSLLSSSLCDPTIYRQSTQPSIVVLPLLVMGYWFTSLGQVPHWWCAERGRLESQVVMDTLLNAAPGDPAAAMRADGRTPAGRDPEFDTATQEAIAEFVDWRRRRLGERGGR